MTEDLKSIMPSRDDLNREMFERNKSEEELARLNDQLASKNRELEQIVYVTSHDLRSPLVNINGFSREIATSLDDLKSLLLRRESSPELKEKIHNIIEKDIPESLKFIVTSSSKMDSLLSGLLRLSRLGRAELKCEGLNMNKLMSDIVSSFEFQAKESGIKIDISILPSCNGDESQINQVFFNLIGNAVKYLSPERQGVVKVSGYSEDGQSVYCVEDNGIGIAPEHQEKIFEIFYQLEPGQSAGEGLGLTIVKRILEKHNGKIWLESEKGRGSRVYVHLPA